MRALLSLIATAGAAVLLAGCGGGTELAGQPPATTAATAEVSAPPLPQGSETVEFDAADFVARIDNQYWPMNPATGGSTASPMSREPSSASPSP